MGSSTEVKRIKITSSDVIRFENLYKHYQYKGRIIKAAQDLASDDPVLNIEMENLGNLMKSGEKFKVKNPTL